MTRLIAAINRLNDWHILGALPLWARAGADETGAFFEALDFAGRPVTGQARRVRVQCRQIHTFTQAAWRGWLPEGEAIAARAFNRLVETACPDGGARGCVHLIDDNGAVIDATRDLYDQAFLLLACASRIEAEKDPNAYNIAERTLKFLDRELASPHGGYKENDGAATPRRQNPHMHLFEAMTALYAATGDPSFLARARAIEELFNARFLDRNSGGIREFFGEDWSPDARAGERIEPGHMSEWIFLLDRFALLAGEDRTDMKHLLYRAVLKMSAPGDAPFLPNSLMLGQPAARGARRLWPQTEALKAALVMARDGDAAAAAHAASIIDALFETYLAKDIPGLWQDEFDAGGRAVASQVPASILYHIHEAVSCAAECRHKLVP